jgi:DNA-binding beta-propeller fold protein YncE
MGVAKAYRAAMLVSLLAIGLATGPTVAAAQPTPTLLGCVSGNNRVAAAQGCSTEPGSGGRADRAGLKGVVALAGGGTTTSLYAIGSENSAITQLVAGSSGRLKFAACLTGNTFIERSCPPVPGAYANSDQAPIAYPTAAAVSPDGRWLYLVSGSFHGSVIARFSREPLTGTLAYVDCLTGDTDPSPTGVLSCTLIPGADHGGYGSGLNEPTGLVVSADGRRLYVTAGLNQTLTTFARDPATGALSFDGCLSTTSRTTQCKHLSIGRWGFEGLSEPLLSPDGRFLYAGASAAGTIDTFRIGPSGTPTFAGCLGGEGEVERCQFKRGPLSALEQPTGLAPSPDWHFLYATSGYGAIVALRRNATTGALTPASCISGDEDHRGLCTPAPATVTHGHPSAHTSALTGIRRPLVSANGRLLFAPVRTQDALVELRRNPHTGALSFLSCITGSLRVATRGVCKPIPGATKHGGASGFSKLTTLTRGPEGLIYAASFADATVWTIRP